MIACETNECSACIVHTLPAPYFPTHPTRVTPTHTHTHTQPTDFAHVWHLVSYLFGLQDSFVSWMHAVSQSIERRFDHGVPAECSEDDLMRWDMCQVLLAILKAFWNMRKNPCPIPEESDWKTGLLPPTTRCPKTEVQDELMSDLFDAVTAIESFHRKHNSEQQYLLDIMFSPLADGETENHFECMMRMLQVPEARVGSKLVIISTDLVHSSTCQHLALVNLSDVYASTGPTFAPGAVLRRWSESTAHQSTEARVPTLQAQVFAPAGPCGHEQMEHLASGHLCGFIPRLRERTRCFCWHR